MIMHRPQPGKGISLRRAIVTHPQIWPILCRAQQLRRGDWRGYSRLSDELRRYVGWAATDPQLATAEAYEVAHQILAVSMGGLGRNKDQPGKTTDH